MALMSFFKRTQHQRFEYNPRYYDPDKEDLQARLRAARRDKDNDPDAIKARISSSFRKKHMKQKGTGNTKLLNTNLLLIAIIIILFGLTYLFLTVYLPEIVEMVE